MECVEFLANLDNARKLARKFLNSKGNRDVDTLETLAGDIYLAATEFNGAGDFKPFIIQRAKWAMCKLFRKVDKKVQALSDKFDVPAAESVAMVDVEEFMNTLSGDEKRIAELSAEGFSVRDIAEQVDIGVNQVCGIINRVKSKVLEFV